MRTITNTTSLVSENVRGTALASNAFPFCASYRSRESSFSQRRHFHSDVPLHKKHTSRLNTPQTPKEGLVLLVTKSTPKRGKESLASEQTHCLLIKPPLTQLSSLQQPKDQPSTKILPPPSHYSLGHFSQEI